MPMEGLATWNSSRSPMTSSSRTPSVASRLMSSRPPRSTKLPWHASVNASRPPWARIRSSIPRRTRPSSAGSSCESGMNCLTVQLRPSSERWAPTCEKMAAGPSERPSEPISGIQHEGNCHDAHGVPGRAAGLHQRACPC